jgi:hypothetical protein
MEEVLDILKGIGRPVLFSKGNHDDSIAYKKIILPYLSGILKQEMNRNYYNFQYQNSSFLFIDDADFTAGTQQYKWLKKELENNKDKNNIFLSAHSPLFPVARPFFTDRKFLDLILPLLNSNPINGYFCGHTHNQCLTTHTLADNRIFQAKSSIIGYPGEGMPLHRVRKLISGDYEYHVGYLEDSCPSWLYVKIDRKAGNLGWQVFPSGKVADLKWQKRGELEITRNDMVSPFVKMNADGLKNIKSARLNMAMYNSKGRDKPVRFNGQEVGFVPTGTSFAPRKVLQIPDKKISLIDMENTIEIGNPNRELFLIGGISLEVVLANGDKAITNVSPSFYATSHQWDDWNVKELKFFQPGKKIGPIKLRFK